MNGAAPEAPVVRLAKTADVPALSQFRCTPLAGPAPTYVQEVEDWFRTEAVRRAFNPRNQADRIRLLVVEDSKGLEASSVLMAAVAHGWMYDLNDRCVKVDMDAILLCAAAIATPFQGATITEIGSRLSHFVIEAVLNDIAAHRPGTPIIGSVHRNNVRSRRLCDIFGLAYHCQPAWNKRFETRRRP